MSTLKVVCGEIELEISRATLLMGIRRKQLMEQGRQVPDTDAEVHLWRLFLYPDLVACVSEAKGTVWPPTFEQFLDMPEELIKDWEVATYQLNPHWLGVGDKKKVPTKSNGAWLIG